MLEVIDCHYIPSCVVVQTDDTAGPDPPHPNLTLLRTRGTSGENKEQQPGKAHYLHTKKKKEKDDLYVYYKNEKGNFIFRKRMDSKTIFPDYNPLRNQF